MAEIITPTPDQKLENDILSFVKVLTDKAIADRNAKKPEWMDMGFDDFIDHQEKRFKAMRSVRGLDYNDLPKTSPWPGCSDIGIPIEAITIQSIVARCDRVEFERLPLTHVTAVGKKDLITAPKIEAYLDWQKINKMKVRIPKMLGTRKALTVGSYFWKIIFEEFYVYDDEDVIALRDPDDKTILRDESGEIVEWNVDEPTPLNDSQHSYELVLLKSPKKKVYYRGPAMYGRDPRQILWDVSETNYDPQEWDWWADLYDRSVEWLETTGVSIGLKNVEQIVAKLYLKAKETGTDRVDKKKPIKIREWYGRYEINGRMRDIVAVIAPEYDVILGWKYDEFMQKTGMTRLVHRCALPMDGQVLGMSIPMFIKGLRDAIDASWNQMVDRGSRFNNPPVIYQHGSGFDPMKHNWGYRFWPEKVTNSIRVLSTPHTEPIEFQKIQLLIGLVQRLFGVTDTTSGVDNPNNQTYGGITTLLAEGNVNIDMLIQTINESNIQLDQLIIAMNAAYAKTDVNGDPIPEEFPVIDSYSAVLEDPDNPFVVITQEELMGKYNYMPSGASLTINTRSLREEALYLYNEAVKTANANPFIDLEVLREVTTDLFKSFGKKNISIKTVEEKQQEMQMQAQQAMQAQQEQQNAESQRKAAEQEMKVRGDVAKTIVKGQVGGR